MKKTFIVVCILCSLGFLLFISGLYQSWANIVPDNTSNSETNQEEDNDPKEEKVEKKYTNYLEESKVFELPINGASGYASINMNLLLNPYDASEVLASIKAGEGFTILQEQNEYWQVQYHEQIGYVKHRDCFINLPDVIPSIIYNITNSKSSQMVSSNTDIPNVTNEKLYDVYKYSSRFMEDEYVVPVLYSMAKKIAMAQQYARLENNTLVIYEAFRPYEVQRRVVNNLYNLANTNSDVKKGITSAPWSMTWFIATGVSNHQRGCAIDVSLGKILETTDKYVGDYVYNDITEYQEYTMYSKMHELSIASVLFKYPVDSIYKEDLINVPLRDYVNKEVKLLESYCYKAELAPLASEWWHFNDLDSLRNAKSDGKYYIEGNFSIVPYKGLSRN